MKAITDFRGVYSFLSNFYHAVVWYGGWSYPTNEHAFQAAKTLKEEERTRIRLAGSPGEAKRLGRKVNLRPDWEEVKNLVMVELLRVKFSPLIHPDLAKKLLATADAELMEGNTWGDTYWGCVQQGGLWTGRNALGILLMEVRGEIEWKYERLQSVSEVAQPRRGVRKPR